MRLRYWFINYPYCRLRRAGGRGCVNCALRLWCPLPNQPPSAAVFLKQVTGIRCTLELLKNQLSFDWHRRCVASGWTVYDQKKKKIPKYLVLPHRFPVLICNPSHPTLNRGRGSPGRWVCFPVREPKAFWEAAFLPSFSFGGNCWLVAAPQWMGQVVKAETIAHSHSHLPNSYEDGVGLFRSTIHQLQPIGFTPFTVTVELMMAFHMGLSFKCI